MANVELSSVLGTEPHEYEPSAKAVAKSKMQIPSFMKMKHGNMGSKFMIP